MSNVPTITEDEARAAWADRVNRHSLELTEAASEHADEQVSRAHGLEPNDFLGHGIEVRTAWYVAAAKYVDEHCGACAGQPPKTTETEEN